MVTVGTILMVAAFVIVLLAAVAWQALVEPYRLRMIAAALACWLLAILIGGVKL